MAYRPSLARGACRAILLLALAGSGCGSSSHPCGDFLTTKCNTSDIVVSASMPAQAETLDCWLTLSSSLTGANVTYGFPAMGEPGGKACVAIASPAFSSCRRSSAGLGVEFSGGQAADLVHALELQPSALDAFDITVTCGALTPQVSHQALCNAVCP
jgi:hypothetical protein